MHTQIYEQNLKNWPFHIPKGLKLILHKSKHRKGLPRTRPTKIVYEATIRTPLVTSINYLCLFYVACLKVQSALLQFFKSVRFFSLVKICVLNILQLSRYPQIILSMYIYVYYRTLSMENGIWHGCKKFMLQSLLENIDLKMMLSSLRKKPWQKQSNSKDLLDDETYLSSYFIVFVDFLFINVC